jgi:hypothetical protein
MHSVQRLAVNYGFITNTENDNKEQNKTYTRTNETNKKSPEPDEII